MPNRNKRRARPQKRSTGRAMIGSTRSQRFLQYLGHQNILAIAGSLTTTGYPYNLLASDLNSGRLLHLRSVVVKFYPVTVSVPPAGLYISRVSAQLQMVDPATNIAVPISAVVPLSGVNMVRIRGNLPFFNWQNAGSAANALIITVYNADGLVSVVVDIESTFLLAQDTL